MFKTIITFLLLLSFIITNPLPGQDHPDPVTLKTGSKAPDFKLSGTDGKLYTLSNFNNYNVLVVIFSCNHCPTAQAYEDRIIKLAGDYKSQQVGFVMIQPNSPKALSLSEMGYTDLGDDFADMKKRAKEKKFNFPYLYDGETQKTSIAYGPIATPHAFVFDRQRLLKYNGRLDASEKPGTGNAEDLRAALDAILTKKQVSSPVTKTFGCSVKWSWKDEYTRQLIKEWASLPVTIENIDVNEVKNLVANIEKGKLRLINVWATWCGPCVQELPEFVKIDRMYRERDFEFITISLDDKLKKDKALDRLKKLQASNKNYLFDGKDKYQFIEALDPKWQGALPYTLLVEPGGKIVFGKQGPVDPLQLKKIIVESKYIGRYY
jgi:thiol-disulfide isomerase/thioredoxin